MIWNIHYVQIEYIKLLFCFSIVFIQISGFYHKLFGVPPFWILLWDPNQYKKWNLCNTVTFVILKCFHLTNSFVRGKNQRAAFFVADKSFFFLNKRCNFTRKFVRFWKWKGHFVFSRLHFSSLKKYVKWKQVKVTNMIQIKQALYKFNLGPTFFVHRFGIIMRWRLHISVSVKRPPSSPKKSSNASRSK